jgi:hypothetical protein
MDMYNEINDIIYFMPIYYITIESFFESFLFINH